MINGGSPAMTSMPRLTKAICGVLSLVVASASSAADSKNAQRLVGTWLVEPLYFDVMADTGVVLPEFPVLVMRPDGQFKLFRIIYGCRLHDAQGRDVYWDDDPKRAKPSG